MREAWFSVVVQELEVMIVSEWPRVLFEAQSESVQKRLVLLLQKPALQAAVQRTVRLLRLVWPLFDLLQSAPGLVRRGSPAQQKFPPALELPP